MPFKITFMGKEGQKGSFESPDKKGYIISLPAGESVTTEKEPKDLPKAFFKVEGGTIRLKKGEKLEQDETEKLVKPEEEPEEEKEKKEISEELPINKEESEEDNKLKEETKSKKDSKKKKKKGDK